MLNQFIITGKLFHEGNKYHLEDDDTKDKIILELSDDMKEVIVDLDQGSYSAVRGRITVIKGYPRLLVTSIATIS